MSINIYTMKRLLLLLFLITFFYNYGQNLREDYYTLGYRVGCELGKGADTKIYISTISNSNFPQEYRIGVTEGYQICYEPVKLEGSGYRDTSGSRLSSKLDKLECTILKDLRACVRYLSREKKGDKQ